MRRSTRRLLFLFATLPVTVLGLAWLYQIGMDQLEGTPRSFGASIEWAAETMTTTGYGQDARWEHPAMQVFVVLVQFSGVFMTFLVFPVFLIPFFEERFEGRIPTEISPKARDYILVYRWGPAVSELIDVLDQERVQVIVLEEDFEVARRLHDRGRSVVYGSFDDHDDPLGDLAHARGLVANGTDHENAIVTLTARQLGFEGPIVALVQEPRLRGPMRRAGASAAFTPRHALAAAAAAKASVKISPRVAGIGSLGKHLVVAEVRISEGSVLAGKTLDQAQVRQRTGTTVLGRWNAGQLDAQPGAHVPLEVGDILVVAGGDDAIVKISQLATPLVKDGHFVLVGYDGTGRKVAQFLRDAGEEVRVVHTEAGPDVDFVGELLDADLLREAGALDAQAVLCTMDNDPETVFAAAVVRDLANDVVIVATVDRAENVARIHRAGADFAVAIGQVAGQMLASQLLGEDSVSLHREIKVARAAAGSLAGQKLLSSQLRQRTGCSVVGVERGSQVIVDFGAEFTIEAQDTVYVSGTPETIQDYFELIAGSRPTS